MGYIAVSQAAFIIKREMIENRRAIGLLENRRSSNEMENEGMTLYYLGLKTNFLKLIDYHFSVKWFHNVVITPRLNRCDKCIFI